MFYYNQNANNYIQVKLLDSLKAGKRYYCAHYVSLPNTYLKGCNNIAMLFTNNPIYVDTNSATYPYLLQANPQIVGYGNPIVTDTMGWVKISGIFTAQGGEQYLTLGNFKLANQTQFTQIAPFGTGYNGAAYYVDDVAVYNLDSFCLKADAGRDTTIKVGDSVFIGSYTNGIDSLMWLENGTIKRDSTHPGFWFTPSATGTYMYVLQQTVNGCFSSDTVYINAVLPLTMLDVRCKMLDIGRIEVSWNTANEVNVSHYNIEHSIDGRYFTVIGKVKANNKSSNEYNFTDENVNDRMNYYRVVGIDKDGKKTYSVVRKIEYRISNTEVNIYPNPVVNKLKIANNSNINKVEIVNTLGVVILQQNVCKVSIVELNVNHLQKGIYLLRAFDGNGKVFNSKFIKQ